MSFKNQKKRYFRQRKFIFVKINTKENDLGRRKIIPNESMLTQKRMSPGMDKYVGKSKLI